MMQNFPNFPIIHITNNMYKHTHKNNACILDRS